MKKFLGILLVLTMVFSFSCYAYAETVDYGITVDGTVITSDNSSDVFGDGKVSYDPATGTLTLGNPETASVVSTGTAPLIISKTVMTNSGVTLRITTAGDLQFDAKTPGTVVYDSLNITCGGNLTINKYTTAPFCSSGSGSVSFEAAGNVVLDEKSGNSFGSGFHIVNAVNVTIQASTSSALFTGPADVRATGDVLIQNSGTGNLSVGNLDIGTPSDKVASITLKGNTGSAMLTGLINVYASGDVLIENTGTGAVTVNSMTAFGKDITVKGAPADSDTFAIYGGSFLATGKVNLQNNGSGYLSLYGLNIYQATDVTLTAASAGLVKNSGITIENVSGNVVLNTRAPQGSTDSINGMLSIGSSSDETNPSSVTINVSGDGNMVNGKTNIYAAGDVTVNAALTGYGYTSSLLFRNLTTIQTTGNVSITNTGDSGHFCAGDTLTIVGKDISLSNAGSGMISTNDSPLVLTATGGITAVTNNGMISASPVTVTAAGNVSLESKGSMLIAGSLTLTAKKAELKANTSSPAMSGNLTLQTEEGFEFTNSKGYLPTGTITYNTIGTAKAKAYTAIDATEGGIECESGSPLTSNPDFGSFRKLAQTVETTTPVTPPVTPSTPSGGYTPSEYKVSVPETVENGTVSADLSSAKYGETVSVTVTPAEGYVVDTVVVKTASGQAIEVKAEENGQYTFAMPAGQVIIEATFKAAEAEGTTEPGETADPEGTNSKDASSIVTGVENTTVKAGSKLVTLKSGKKAVKISWEKSKGYKVDYYEIYRSTYRNSGYGKTPYFVTKDGQTTQYTNTKGLQEGTTYYYKVRGVRIIDGEKYYTSYSTKAIRTVK